MTFQPRHLSAAALLHVLVFGLLLSGVQCTQKVPPQKIIQAVLYDPSRAQLQQQEARQERERRAAEERRKKQEAERARLAAEKKRKAEEARKKAEAEAARKKAEEARKKAEAEAQRKKELQEKQEREAAERRKAQLQREIAQENLRRQMEQEASAREQASIAAQVNEWGALVQRHIQKNWIRPSTSTEDFSCGVRVVLLPDGSVTSARVTQSCGNPVLDKSVVDAVFRSSPIPRPRDPAAFQRELNITFVPR